MQMEKNWTRRYNLNFMATYVWALNFNATKILKQPIPSVLGQGVNEQTSSWMGTKDKAKFDLKIAKLFLKNWRSFKKYINAYQKSKDKFIMAAQKVNSKNFESISNPKLALIYWQFEKTHSEFMLIGQWTAFELIERIPQIVETKLARGKIPAGAIDKILSTILTQFKATKAFKSDEKVLELAYKSKNKIIANKKLHQEVLGLVKNYGWLPSMVVDAPLWDYKFFEKQINKRKNSADLMQSLKDFKKMQEEKKKKQKDFKNWLLQYPKFRELFKIANWLIYLKDERDETRRFGYFLARPLFYEIAKRAKLDISELLTFSPPEISVFLKGTAPLPLKEIKKRLHSFIIFVKDKQFVIYSGKKADYFTQRYFEKEKAAKDKKIFGITASPGKVKGRAVRIMDKQDLKKVERGNIIIAVTTHPDYLPAMKLAKAIVTDEGGLTCHAAIVSRELKIPCIVGTKIATKVLKDGDLVEVDANNGLVKLLKKTPAVKNVQTRFR